MPKRPSFILNGLVGTAFIIYDDKLERFDRNNKKIRWKFLAYQQSCFGSR